MPPKSIDILNKNVKTFKRIFSKKFMQYSFSISIKKKRSAVSAKRFHSSLCILSYLLVDVQNLEFVEYLQHFL